MFISCEKEYGSSNIENIRKIKELLLDVDCDKGIMINSDSYYSGNYSGGSGSTSSSDILYCDAWQIDETNIDDLYKGLGKITSVTYNRIQNI